MSEMRELLVDVEAFLDQQADVDDGTPNEAMRLKERVNEVLDRPDPTPHLTAAVERLRGASGPGGMRRADIMTLCLAVDSLTERLEEARRLVWSARETLNKVGLL